MSALEGARVPPTTYEELAPPARQAPRRAPADGPHHQHEADAAAFGAGVRRADEVVSAAGHGAAVPGRAPDHALRPRRLGRDRLPDLLHLLPPAADRGGRGSRPAALDECESAVVAFGRALARHAPPVPDEVFAPLAARLTREQIVALTAFGALMVATNVFNNALDVTSTSTWSRSGGQEDASMGELHAGRWRSSPARPTGRAGRRRSRWRARARRFAAFDVARPLAYPGYGMGTRDDLESLAAECRGGWRRLRDLRRRCARRRGDHARGGRGGGALRPDRHPVQQRGDLRLRAGPRAHRGAPGTRCSTSTSRARGWWPGG